MTKRRPSLLSKLIVGISLAVLAVEVIVLAPVVLKYRSDLADARRESAALVTRVLAFAPDRDPEDKAAQWLLERQLAEAQAALYDDALRPTSGRAPAPGSPEHDAVACALAEARRTRAPVTVERADVVAHAAPVPGGGFLATAAPIAPGGKLAHQVLVAMAVVLVVLIGIGVAVIALVYRHILRPMAALTNANRAVVEGNEPRALVPDPAIPDDELGDAIRSRNELYRRMREFQESIREKNEVLARQGQELGRWALELERRVRAKSEELLKAHDRLLESEKLASSGRLAAGIAHEINNPLASIAGYAEDLRSLAKDPALAAVPAFADFPDSLAVIEEQAFRCKKIIRQLLTFARPAAFAPEPLDLAQLVEDVLPLVEHKGRGREVAIAVDERPGTPNVMADKAHLMQVIVNLVENAFDAIPEETGEIAITIRRASPRSERDAGTVAVDVRDTGRGIPEANRRKIFDPFFTTKPVGKGTGLGLSICHSIVARMGGRIEVASEMGRGSTFTVVLPATVELATVEAR